jgi:ATP-dependent helicase HrpA
MREWEELFRQLQDVAGELGWRASGQPVDYANLHRALLCGLLSNIGQKIEGNAVRGEYRGARELRFLIAPGTPVRARPPRWLVCSQIVESARVYARGVAMVEPQWIEWAGRHLLKREYLEPQWNPRRGTVYARERVILYGLVLAADRRVDYGRVAPAEAREIFVHEALVNGNSRLDAPFLAHNAALRQQLIAEEAALRRHAILVDELTQAQFYLARLPPEVNSLDRFEGWRWGAERSSPRLLFMQESDLRLPDAPPVDRACYPTHWAVGESLLPVSYEFDPGSHTDGATVRVPIRLAEKLDRGDLDWGIEGWRLEKIVAILRGLPKTQRRELVPVPAVAERLLRRLGTQRSSPFYEALSDALRAEASVPIAASALASIALPPWLRLNLALLDPEGRVIATSREAGDLRRAGHSPDGRAEREGLRTWDFDALAEHVSVEQQGVRLQLYPALTDRGDSVALELQADAPRAAALTRQGALRLLSLALGPAIRLLTREIAGERDLVLLHIVEHALLRVCLPADLPTPRTRAEFEAARERGVRGLTDAVHQLAEQLRGILAQNLQIMRALEALSPALNANLVADLRRSRARLVHPGFVSTTPDPWLDSLPRYLQALERRIAKLPGAHGAGARAQEEIRQRWERYEALSALADSLDTQRPAALVELRWLIEEYGVSLFAQELKTLVTVSSKRVDEAELAARRAVDVLR